MPVDHKSYCPTKFELPACQPTKKYHSNIKYKNNYFCLEKG